MRSVWAPWRINYILSKKQKSCVFCIKKTRGYKKRHYILAESKHSFILLNKYPYTAGHLMVLPQRHISELMFLKNNEHIDFFNMLNFATKALKKAIKPDALNIGANLGKAAGSGIGEHLHFHIVARWNGDHNFMPVVSKTMVISEYLDDTYNRLSPYFKKDYLNCNNE
jgi:ATP adenylyltransferase